MEAKEHKETFQKFSLKKERAQKIFGLYELGAVERIRRFDEGMINDVFSVNENYVVKVNTAHPDLPKLEKEYAVYSTLEGSDVPVPRAIGLDLSREVVPYPYLVCEQLVGQSLESLRKSLGGEVPGSLFVEMGEYLGKIHVFGPENLALPGQGKYLGLKQDIAQRIEKISGEISAAEVLDADLISRIKDFYLHSLLFGEEVFPSLLHGNYVFGNVMVRDEKIVGIIDWEFSSFGHSEEELATFLYRVCKTDTQRDLFMSGYKKQRSVSPDFDKRLLPYALLYYLKVLPSVPTWTHRPDKQKEYLDETAKLIKEIGI